MVFQMDVDEADDTNFISSTLRIKSSERNEEIVSEYNEIIYSTFQEVSLCFISEYSAKNLIRKTFCDRKI